MTLKYSRPVRFQDFLLWLVLLVHLNTHSLISFISDFLQKFISIINLRRSSKCTASEFRGNCVYFDLRSRFLSWWQYLEQYPTINELLLPEHTIYLTCCGDLLFEQSWNLKIIWNQFSNFREKSCFVSSYDLRKWRHESSIFMQMYLVMFQIMQCLYSHREEGDGQQLLNSQEKIKTA